MNAVILNDLAPSWSADDPSQFATRLFAKLYPPGRKVPPASVTVECKVRRRVEKIISNLKQALMISDIKAAVSAVWKCLVPLLWPHTASTRTIKEEIVQGFAPATAQLENLRKEKLGLKQVTARKRKLRTAQVRAGDVGWWAIMFNKNSAITVENAVLYLQEHVGLMRALWLLEYAVGLVHERLQQEAEAEQAEALALDDDPLERNLRKKEAEIAAKRALNPIDDPKANAPKSKSAKPRVTTLSGLEASKLQNSLAEIREEQRTKPDTTAPEKPSSKTVQSQAEFIAELAAERAETLVAPEPEMLVDAEPSVPIGRTNKQKQQDLLEQLWQPKAKRHSAGPVFHPPKPVPRQPSFAIRWERIERCVYIENLRKNLAAVRCQSYAPELIALYEHHENEARKALVRIGRNKSMTKVKQCEDHLLEMMAVNDLAAQRAAMLVMEVPLVNPLITLANMFGRWFSIPRISQARLTRGRAASQQQEAI